MTHILKGAYDKACKNRPPPKEPPITKSYMTQDEIAKRYPKG